MTFDDSTNGGTPNYVHFSGKSDDKRVTRVLMEKRGGAHGGVSNSDDVELLQLDDNEIFGAGSLQVAGRQE